MATYNDKEVIGEKEIGLTTNVSPESGLDNIITRKERSIMDPNGCHSEIAHPKKGYQT